MIRPAHGYLIAQILNDIIGPYAKVSNGRLYPLLAKLEEQGLIVAYEESDAERGNGRQIRSYAITEAGRQRWCELMMDTTSNPGEYQKFFLHKAAYLHLLQPAERMHLLDHYLNYCQAHVLHMKAEAEDLKQLPAEVWQVESLDYVMNTMQHIIAQWQLELDWAISLRERELAQTDRALQEVGHHDPNSRGVAHGTSLQPLASPL